MLESGCRLIMATDGVWDILTKTTVSKIARNHNIKNAPNQILTAGIFSQQWSISDDMTIFIIDFLPSFESDFKLIVNKLRKKNNGIFNCFSCGHTSVKEDLEESEDFSPFTDFDGYEIFQNSEI